MKKTAIIYGSSTGTCEDLAKRLADKLGVDASDVLDVANIDEQTVAKYDNLILVPPPGGPARCRTTGTTV